MNWADLEVDLDTDLLTAARELESAPSTPHFAFAENRFLRRDAKERIKKGRRGIRKFIRPENADCVLQHLPEPGQHTHAILRGDFVLCDLVPAIIARRGRCEALHIATLGLSAANAECLVTLQERGEVGSFDVLCSHYFQQVDKATTYREVAAKLEGKGRLMVARNHAKVICLPTAGGDHFVIEGSANLRSSDNVEQIAIFNDQELLQWHASWIVELGMKGGRDG
jgi:hypothetical protein